MKNFAEVAKTLYRLTSKGVKFTWEKELEDAFQLLKTSLLQAPILERPIFRHPFVIDTDASETALGAVLSQIIDGEERPIAFESTVLSKKEVNYARTTREALGIVQAMQWFRPYIYGSQCLVRTDHASLQWLFRQTADGMTFRMVQKMQKFNYRIVHRLEKNIVTPTDLVEGPMRSQNGNKPKKRSCEVKARSFRQCKKRSVVIKNS